MTTLRRSCKAFLSHSYSADAVNMFFYTLLADVAAISFRVDRGKTTLSTTRLERMIRDAEVFIGIWPLPGFAPDARVSAEQASHSCRYFRLELSMAARARRPGLLITDHRYGNSVHPPTWMTHVLFDADEIALDEAAPSRQYLHRRFESFFTGLDEPPSTPPHAGGPVGVLCGEHEDAVALSTIEDVVAPTKHDVERIELRHGSAALPILQTCDWVIADVSEPDVEMAAAYAYGGSVPVQRLRRSTEAAADPILDKALFPDLTVGYPKDVLTWSNHDELRERLTERIRTIVDPPKLVGDFAAARVYFEGAAERQDRAFLSYAAEDIDTAHPLADCLRRKFGPDQVFDYRDGGRSIPFGARWVDVVFDALAKATVGVILLSADYLRSGHCMEESRRLATGFIEENIQLLVIAVDDSKVPEHLTSSQYARAQNVDPLETLRAFIRQPAAAPGA